MTVQVNSIEELKNAINSGVDEIISYDKEVVSKLKAVKLAKTWGPMAVTGIITAIPLVVSTGPIGAATLYAVAPTAGVTTTTIVALVLAIGGVIAIALFTDWDYVEIGTGGIKMQRKKNRNRIENLNFFVCGSSNSLVV